MSGSDDPVDVYLRSLPPVLSPEAEIQVCRRIEQAKNGWRRIISRCPVVHEVVAALAGEILAGVRKIEDVAAVEVFDVDGMETMRQRFARASLSPRASGETSTLIEGIPFLDKQWRELAHRIEDGVALEAIQAQERQIKSGEKELLTGNLRLVVNIAREREQSGFPVKDLIQMGNIGLLQALESFDGTHGSRFSTYAAWCIRHAISRWIVTMAGEQGMLRDLGPISAGGRWVN